MSIGNWIRRDGLLHIETSALIVIAVAALITISCVLFVQMGLSRAIQDVLHIDLRIVSCPKCLSFWICLAYLMTHDYGIVVSVAASFFLSYCALWLALCYDVLAELYNRAYDKLSQTDDTPEDTEAGDAVTEDPDAYEVS